ncbi:MAG: type II restriction endonuclease subunit M [Azospirillum brasilense]|nr:MAG: type II restriction endonuclease subunit M [Azospirillum brasilense]
MLVLVSAVVKSSKRYASATNDKLEGVAYTPKVLSDFVANKMIDSSSLPNEEIHVLDPAVGRGELLVSILSRLVTKTSARILVYGFDTDGVVLAATQQRLAAAFPQVELHLQRKDFLEYVLGQSSIGRTPSLFDVPAEPIRFDLIIANPPYVRTQIMGADQAQKLASAFGLSGRVDLYHAFLIGMAQVLRPGGTAGIIVSNRFMTTKGGSDLRAELRNRFALRHVWDLGDTKLFDVAVLPAVLLAEGRNGHTLEKIAFTTIYETQDVATSRAPDAIAALASPGVVAIDDGRRFHVQHGTLNDSGPVNDLWRIATDAGDEWLRIVNANTWKRFSDVGKIRVGVKTCADKIFIRSDWSALPEVQRPELLRPLTTHHISGRFRAIRSPKAREILYPHEVVGGQRQPIDLSGYPISRAYLESHRAALEGRTYVLEAGRRWYEIWVPQDPAAWIAPKLVFRDISDKPTFWIDLDGSIVNGDCYWMVAEHQADNDLLWLAAAVSNSTFIEAFYDHRFNNKLYGGRRRFITQYVEQFPLPDPSTPLACKITEMAKAIYDRAGSREAAALETELDPLVWKAFGLQPEKVAG